MGGRRSAGTELRGRTLPLRSEQWGVRQTWTSLESATAVEQHEAVGEAGVNAEHEQRGRAPSPPSTGQEVEAAT